MGTEDRGFGSMDKEKEKENASKGGHSQGKEHSPGNFSNDKDKAREAGHKGGENTKGVSLEESSGDSL